MTGRGNFTKDKSERWLLNQQAGSILKLAGITGFISWKVEESSLVAPRRLPDGLVSVMFPDLQGPVPFIIEIESYANTDADRQMYEDLLIARLELGVIPEVICVVLQPKGNARVVGSFAGTSRLDSSRIDARWRVVELWNLSAEELLEQNDLGLIPWVPLARINGPAEPVLRKCRERIDRQAPEEQRAAYLAVTHILARMVHPSELLDLMFKGKRIMIESPAFLDFENEIIRRSIIAVLEERFGSVPEDILTPLQRLENVDAMNALIRKAGKCRDLAEFKRSVVRYKSNIP
jgi:hypothetical protein